MTNLDKSSDSLTPPNGPVNACCFLAAMATKLTTKIRGELAGGFVREDGTINVWAAGVMATIFLTFEQIGYWGVIFLVWIGWVRI